MEHFVIIVNGWKPFTVIRKCSIFDVAVVLDPPMDFVQVYVSWVGTKLYLGYNNQYGNLGL